MSRQVPAREVIPGQRVLVTSGCRSLTGDIAATQQNGGVVYLWKAPLGTQGAADIVLNHGDPVTVLVEAPPVLAPGQVAPCAEHPASGFIIVETGYTRIWHYDPETGEAYDERIDLESGDGNDEIQCSTCLTPLANRVDFNEVTYS